MNIARKMEVKRTYIEIFPINGIRHEERILDNLTFTGHIKGKTVSGKQRITYLTNW